MMTFDKLGNSGDILLTVFFSHEQAHDNSTQSPGNGIPASAQTHAEGVLGYTDGGSATYSQTDNSNANQGRRQLASGKSIVFIIALTTFFSIPGDAKKGSNVQNQNYK